MEIIELTIKKIIYNMFESSFVPIGINGLGKTSVKGLSLISFPPAIITTEFLLSSDLYFY